MLAGGCGGAAASLDMTYDVVVGEEIARMWRTAKRKSVGSCSGILQEVFLSRRRTKQLVLLIPVAAFCVREKAFRLVCCVGWLVVTKEITGVWGGAQRLRRNGTITEFGMTSRRKSILAYVISKSFSLHHLFWTPSHNRSLSKDLTHLCREGLFVLTLVIAWKNTTLPAP